MVAAGLFNPVGMKLVLISAAAGSLGGTSGLAWLSFYATGMKPKEQTAGGVRVCGPPLNLAPIGTETA